MTDDLRQLENAFWQIGILPETGASMAYGRIRRNDHWVDVMRPTAPADYGNPSQCASYILLPWSNRIRDGKFEFDGNIYQLDTNYHDGTAIHGVARDYPWTVEAVNDERIRLRFDSREHDAVNFPFAFTAGAEYRLEGRSLLMRLSLRNVGQMPMPGGFGYHPYFLRTPGSPAFRRPCRARRCPSP